MRQDKNKNGKKNDIVNMLFKMLKYKKTKSSFAHSVIRKVRKKRKITKEERKKLLAPLKKFFDGTNDKEINNLLLFSAYTQHRDTISCFYWIYGIKTDIPGMKKLSKQSSEAIIEILNKLGYECEVLSNIHLIPVPKTVSEKKVDVNKVVEFTNKENVQNVIKDFRCFLKGERQVLENDNDIKKLANTKFLVLRRKIVFTNECQGKCNLSITEVDIMELLTLDDSIKLLNK